MRTIQAPQAAGGAPPGLASARYRTFEDYVARDPLATSSPTAIETFVVENDVRFSRGWIQVRSYTWASPVEDVWAHKPDAYLLDVALTPRPAHATIAHLALGGKGAPQDMGRVLLIPPGSTTRSGSSAGRQRAMHCVLERALVEDLLPRPPQWDRRKLDEATRLEGGELEWLLLKLCGELREARFASELVVEAFAAALAVALVRRSPFGMREQALRVGGLPPWRLRLIRERAYADGPAPSLSELAVLCGMTVRHLCRAFKAETGQTVGKFVETATAERARLLLAEQGLPVGEVAAALGFANASSFAVAFRRATGLRPSEVEGRRARRSLRPAPAKSA